MAGSQVSMFRGGGVSPNSDPFGQTEKGGQGGGGGGGAKIGHFSWMS